MKEGFESLGLPGQIRAVLKAGAQVCSVERSSEASAETGTHHEEAVAKAFDPVQLRHHRARPVGRAQAASGGLDEKHQRNPVATGVLGVPLLERVIDGQLPSTVLLQRSGGVRRVTQDVLVLRQSEH